MKVTIIAASGGVGRQILTQALASGHEVTAVVRNPKKLSERVRVVTVDLNTAEPAALEAAVRGADAVVSGLGAPTEADAGIATQGTRVVVRAMQKAEVRRLVVVSAAPIATVPVPGRPQPPKHDPGDGFFMRHLLSPLTKAMLRRRYADLALMEETVRQSGLDWTIVRPPRLTDRPLTGRYRTAFGRNLRRGVTVSRADVAHFMLHALEQPETIQQTVGIAQ